MKSSCPPLTRLLGATLGVTFALALALSQPANADGIDRTYVVGEQPRIIAVDPTDGRLYVGNSGGFPVIVSVIEPASGHVTSYPTSGGIPLAIALDPVHRRLYVSSHNLKLDVFDLTTMTIVATLPVYGLGLAVDSDTQRIYAAGA